MHNRWYPGYLQALVVEPRGGLDPECLELPAIEPTRLHAELRGSHGLQVEVPQGTCTEPLAGHKIGSLDVPRRTAVSHQQLYVDNIGGHVTFTRRFRQSRHPVLDFLCGLRLCDDGGPAGSPGDLVC